MELTKKNIPANPALKNGGEPVLSKDLFVRYKDEKDLHDQAFETKPVSYLADCFKRFAKNKASIVAAVIIFLIALYAIIVPLASPRSRVDSVAYPNGYMTVRNIIAEGLLIQGCHDKEYINSEVARVLKLVGLVPEHETGHMMGLQDYYDYDGAANPMGRVDMMDNNIIDHNAWSKFNYGWVSPYVVDQPGTITLRPSVTSGDCLLLPSSSGWNGTPFDEFLLLEYYTPEGVNEQDSLEGYAGRPDLCGFSEKGIRIYHETALLAFQKGELDSITLEQADLSKYGYSDYILHTPETYTKRLVFDSNVDDLTKLETAAGDGNNKKILAEKDFRKALSLSIDRKKFCSEATSGHDDLSAYYRSALHHHFVIDDLVQLVWQRLAGCL